MAACYDLSGKRVFIAGHRGMVGSAILRALAVRGDCECLTVDRRTLDLREQAGVRAWLAEARPDVVVLAAARVGGILANCTYPADFLLDNLMIEANLIQAAHGADVERLLFLGSSCIYPKFAPQPIREEALLTGPLEPTNEWYALAKIAGIKLCQAFRAQHGRRYIAAMPTNLYGPGDNFDLASGHVLPALIRKMHEAKRAQAPSVTIWGTGRPRREFLHVDDLAAACLLLLERYDAPEPINVGTGIDLEIGELARLVAGIVGYHGDIAHDLSKPDGTPRKRLDIRRLAALGWTASIGLDQGIRASYAWFLDHAEAGSRGAAS